ncbi:MAG: hypothetical protein ACREV1_14765 [Gammaproteobacteria bacterium]
MSRSLLYATGLQLSALILFAACLVAATRGRRLVGFTLQITVDDVFRDPDTAGVLERLQVTADAVADGLDERPLV